MWRYFQRLQKFLKTLGIPITTGITTGITNTTGIPKTEVKQIQEF